MSDGAELLGESAQPVAPSSPGGAKDDQADLILREMFHRLGNLFCVVDAVLHLTKQQAKAAGEDTRAFSEAIRRVQAMGRAETASFSTIARSDFAADVQNLLQATLAPYGDQIVISGDSAIAPAGLVRAIALIFHELATNALKHGALSQGEGRVAVHFDASAPRWKFTWTESGGPKVSPPEEQNFGLELIDNLISTTGGAVNLSWRETGLVAVVELLASPQVGPANDEIEDDIPSSQGER